jgi:hypothetical protein
VPPAPRIKALPGWRARAGNSAGVMRSCTGWRAAASLRAGAGARQAPSSTPASTPASTPSGTPAHVPAHNMPAHGSGRACGLAGKPGPGLQSSAVIEPSVSMAPAH